MSTQASEARVKLHHYSGQRTNEIHKNEWHAAIIFTHLRHHRALGKKCWNREEYGLFLAYCVISNPVISFVVRFLSRMYFGSVQLTEDVEKSCLEKGAHDTCRAGHYSYRPVIFFANRIGIGVKVSTRWWFRSLFSAPFVLLLSPIPSSWRRAWRYGHSYESVIGGCQAKTFAWTTGCFDTMEEWRIYRLIPLHSPVAIDGNCDPSTCDSMMHTTYIILSLPRTSRYNSWPTGKRWGLSTIQLRIFLSEQC